MPKVSVLLTSFNHEKFIGEAIDSVLRQTFTDFELLILDDASTDGSWSIIRSYTDPRIKAIRKSANGEMTASMIDVISNVAAGEYIAIHHSDDAWEPDKLEKQVAVLNGAPRICSVFTNARAITEDGTPFADESHFYFSVFDQPNRSRHEWLRHFFISGNALCHPSALIRKKSFLECGYYRHWLWQLGDFDMWVRFAMKHEIHVIPEKLTRFRVRSNPETQISGNSRETRVRSAYEMLPVLDTYRGISSFDELCRIFPEAEKYRRVEGEDLHFVLGLVMLDLATTPVSQLFALELLREAVSDPARAENIHSVYGFDDAAMARLTGKYDVFSVDGAIFADLDIAKHVLDRMASWAGEAQYATFAGIARTLNAQLGEAKAQARAMEAKAKKAEDHAQAMEAKARVAEDQSQHAMRAAREVTDALRLARKRPHIILGHLLKFRVMRTLSSKSSPLPSRMKNRFAKSAGKVDPRRAVLADQLLNDRPEVRHFALD